MKLIDAQYTFDNTKLLFYFTSSGRVDFRELVKDLASVFKTRIELRQIGIRDEAKLIGGLGLCGRPLCCSVFLSDFGQVSIKMAKEQNLSLNSAKISGACGRLMCCLRYEHETYVAETKLTPKKDTAVITPDGEGVVVDNSPLSGTVRVRLNATPEEAPKTYHRDTLTVLGKAQKHVPDNAQAKNTDK
jgi:cell fate regulator YaaT (PSP1 superfamily)